jgi:copper chaperone CopZ
VTQTLTYSVLGIGTGHCRAAIDAEVRALGVALVEVDLDAQRVVVVGLGLDDLAIRRAIYEAGYEARPTPRDGIEEAPTAGYLGAAGTRRGS